MKRSDTIKLIVFSDTHGSTYGMREVIAMHPNADCYLHLGDGSAEFEALCQSMGLPHLGVKGNCDYACDQPLDRVVSFGEFQFYMTHGHICQVKFSDALLKMRGREAGADVILFGHTHIPRIDYFGGEDESHPYYLMNPGSLGNSYGGKPTYGVIEIKGKNILLSHGML